MAKGSKPAAPRNQERPASVPLWMRFFLWGVALGAGILGLSALGLMANRLADTDRFVNWGWPQLYAQIIVANKIGALWHAAFMTLCAAAALWYLLRQRRQRAAAQAGGAAPGGRGAAAVVWALLLLVATDGWLLSRHYVQTVPMSSVDGNPVISILKKDSPGQRVALLSQNGFYNSWLTILFPYHGIIAINTTQAPRMPEDYRSFLGSVGRNPIRLWQLSAVGHVLAPVEAWTQIQNEPGWKDALDLVYSYSVADEAGMAVVPATPQYPGRHVVLRLNKPAPRLALIGGYEEVPDDEALKRLASSTYPLFEKVLVPPGTLSRAPGGGPGGAGTVGTCKLLRYRSGRFELDVNADQPAVLRVSERYDRWWKATVDGRRTPVYRVDYIFQGVLVPQGTHRVVLQYTSPGWMLVSQGAGLAIVTGALLWLLLARVRERRAAGSAH